MGAPSDLHEARVAHLRDLGFLTGHTVEFRLARWELPDVALRDPNRLRLFIGDAKATEASANQETRRRLRSYASAALPWCRGGFSVRVAVCVSIRPSDGWAHLLCDLNARVASTGATTLAPDERLVWVDLPAVLDEFRGRHYRSECAYAADSRRYVLRRRRAL